MCVGRGVSVHVYRKSVNCAHACVHVYRKGCVYMCVGGRGVSCVHVYEGVGVYMCVSGRGVMILLYRKVGELCTCECECIHVCRCVHVCR